MVVSDIAYHASMHRIVLASLGEYPVVKSEVNPPDRSVVAYDLRRDKAEAGVAVLQSPATAVTIVPSSTDAPDWLVLSWPEVDVYEYEDFYSSWYCTQVF